MPSVQWGYWSSVLYHGVGSSVMIEPERRNQVTTIQVRDEISEMLTGEQALIMYFGSHHEIAKFSALGIIREALS